MALRELLLPWDSQPQEAVGLNPDHPLASVCVGLWVASNPRVLAQRGAMSLLTATGTSQDAAPVGMGTRFGSSYADIDIINLPATPEQRMQGVNGSMIAGITCGALVTGEYNAIWSVRDASVVHAFFTLGLDVSSYTGGRLAISLGGSEIIGTAGSARQGQYATYSAQWGAAGRRLYVNGALDSTNADTSQIVASTIQPALGNRQSGGRALNGRLHWWAAFSVNIGDGWHASLSANPWQLFAPRRLYIPSTTIISLPTLSLPTYTPGSLTSSGFRPRVTAT